jgi:hypothetical protein
MKLIGLAVLFNLIIIASGLSQQIPETKIWDKAPHNGFTDLVRFKSHFYCTFREGSDHKPTNGTQLGKVRLLRSKDGEKWDTVALFEINEYDLRDPKLSVTPDNKLMVLMGASKYFRKIKVSAISFVSFSKNGRDFTDPVPVNIEDKIKSKYDWVWRITWYKGNGYGVVYQDPKLDNNYQVRLVKTRDGINYQIICDLILNNRPNEATLRFNNEGEMFALVRRENFTNGVMGISKPPYTKWKWVELKFRLGGPDFEILDDGNLCVGTRKFDPKVKGSNNRTCIMLVDTNGEVKNKFELRSDGDTGYPGLLKYNHQLWISYYSSHEGKASIYLSKIKLKDLVSKGF